MSRVTAAPGTPTKPVYVFCVPGTLTTSSSAPWIPGQGKTVSKARGVVKTAPGATGADLHVLIELINPSNPTAEVTLGTLVIPAGDFEGTLTFTATNVPVDHVLAISISQTGTAPSDLTVTVS